MEKSEVPSLAGERTAHTSDSEYSTREHLRLRNTFNRVAGYRINSKNQ